MEAGLVIGRKLVPCCCAAEGSVLDELRSLIAELWKQGGDAPDVEEEQDLKAHNKYDCHDGERPGGPQRHGRVAERLRWMGQHRLFYLDNVHDKDAYGDIDKRCEDLCGVDGGCDGVHEPEGNDAAGRESDFKGHHRKGE